MPVQDRRMRISPWPGLGTGTSSRLSVKLGPASLTQAALVVEGMEGEASPMIEIWLVSEDGICAAREIMVCLAVP